MATDLNQSSRLRSRHNRHEGHKGFENENIVSLVSFVVNAVGYTELKDALGFQLLFVFATLERARLEQRP